MRRISVVGALAVGMAAAGGSAAVAEPEIGVVVQQEYSGAVGTRAAGPTEELNYFRTIFAEERVDTDAVATTSLQFLDDTNLYVGSHSSVLLDRFIYDPSTQNGEAAINFTKGAFRFITGNIKSKEAVNLNTPTASMVIRGTHLLIFVLPDGTSEINVLEGAVDLLPCQSADAQRINAGEAITITPSCETGRTGARSDDQRAGLIPQLPTDLAAIQEIQPAAGGEEEEPHRYEESGKGDDKDRDRQRGETKGPTRN